MMMEILLSLLPIGLLQTYQSVSTGYWSARSPECMQTGVMQFLWWMRMAGDTIFAIGAVAFGYFVKVNFSAFKGRKTHGTSDMASRSPRSAMIVQPIT